MTYNIIGDVHGRKQALYLFDPTCINVFIGDYFAPYTNISWEEQLQVFNSILKFKELYPETILLIGNHDLDYIDLESEPWLCRHDTKHELEINKLFNDNLDKFQVAYNINNQYIISHAGISITWYINRFKKSYAIRTVSLKDVVKDVWIEGNSIEEAIENADKVLSYPIKVDLEQKPVLIWNNTYYYYSKPNWIPFTDSVEKIVNSINQLFNKNPKAFSFDSNVTLFSDNDGSSYTHSPLWIRPKCLMQNNIFNFTDNIIQIIGHTKVKHVFLTPKQFKLCFTDCLSDCTESLKIDINEN